MRAHIDNVANWLDCPHFGIFLIFQPYFKRVRIVVACYPNIEEAIIYTMSRSLVRQQVNTSRNENKHDERSERVKDLIKIEKVNRQDSFESHFEVSTRGDGSFEYSDYDDQSFNQSQSFMDQTHGPALLAFVEDYILGQRLEILDTCETEEDAASSSSSSFGSETCNSREESRIYKYFKTTNRGISSKNIENTKVEVPITTDTVHETVVTKKSRWEYLLQGLSAVKRKEYIDNQTHSLTLTNKKDKIIMSRPKFLAAIKAKTSSKETETFRNEETDVANPIDMSQHRVRNSLSEETSTCDVATKSLDDLQCTKLEDEKQVFTNTISMEQAGIYANDSISESKSGHPHTFEITDAEHMEKLLTVYSQQGTLINVAQNSKEATLKPINTNVVNVSNDSEVNLSVHSDGVEIPNIPQFEIQSSPPIKSRTDKYFLRGRATRHERLVATCTGLCDTNQSDVANVKRCVENQIDSTALRKPILCSKCRGTLTDNSVCALLSHESFITLPETGIPLSDIEVEPNVCFSIDPSNSRAPTLGLINEECDMGCEMNDNVAEKNDSATVDHSTRSLGEKAIKETLDPNCESGFCCEAPVPDPIHNRAASVIHLDSAQNEEQKDSPVANIETTIAGGSPCRRSTTPTVQIEFKDWTGNDVEIIKESPRKNRLHWIQGVVSNNKTPPIESESSTTCVKNTHERKKDEDDIIKEEKQFHSSASVCNFEMTSCVHEKKLTKSRYFGRERAKQDLEEKTVRISAVNIPNSVTEDMDDAISQENTECCLESSAASLTSRVLQEENSCGGQEDAVTKLHTTTQSNPIHDTEEAFILERAMQQVHTDEKFTIGHSRTRSRISSPVTLYRFLDFNPCRNELVQGNSYDFVYDPIGLAVCQVPNLDLPITIASGKNMSDLEVKKQNVASMEAKSIHHKPGSSLKKVLRRLSKPNKVAFRENLVDVYSKDSEVHFANTTIMELPDQTEVLDDNAATDVGFGNSRNISGTKNTPRQSELKIATKDKLKALMTEKSKGKRDNMQCKELVRHGSNKSLGGSNMSLGSAAKVLAALKAEFMKRRMSNHKEQLSKSEAHKEQLPQRNTHEKKKQIEVLPKLSNANAALILQEFKKAHATGILDRGNELEISAQEGSDGTIATSGTKQSQISSVSRLTVEEKKLAHRLLNDIQLLAMIEKKRQSMGQLKSSLKSADIDKSVKLLKSIEASRKSRASKDSDSKISTTIKQLASKSTEKPNDFHSLTKNASVVGKKLSTLTDITSTEKFNK